MSRVERAYWVRWFSATLARLGEADFYLLGGRLTARSTHTKNLPRVVPSGAQLIGRYRHPYPAQNFIEHFFAAIEKGRAKA